MIESSTSSIMKEKQLLPVLLLILGWVGMALVSCPGGIGTEEHPVDI